MLHAAGLRTLFTWIARFEGASLLLLVGVCVPLKHIWHWPLGVEVVGMAHGILFLLYVAALVVITYTLRWPRVFAIGAFVASVIPFGTFVMERRMPAPSDDAR